MVGELIFEIISIASSTMISSSSSSFNIEAKNSTDSTF